MNTHINTKTNTKTKTPIGVASIIAGVLFFATLTPVEAVMKQQVSFESDGQTLAGDLYLPDSYQPGIPLPAVVVTGSWTSVKEQMPGGYAAEMARRGYVALAFDFRGWGQSVEQVARRVGLGRFVENPTEKTKDILAAAEFLATRPEVDSDKIAVLGICASAGYATDAAAQSPTIKSAAVVAPWYHDADIVAEVYGEHVAPLLEASKAAQAKYEASGEETIVVAASVDDATAVMQGETYYTDPKRGLIPEYDNKFNVMSWQPWLEYDAIQTADKLDKPMLVIHSEAAAIPQGAKKFLANASDKTQAIWLDGVTQFDFYDMPKVMAEASDAVAAHFASTL